MAADVGHAQSIFNLGLMTLRGEGGLVKDSAKAIQLLSQAAERGLAQVWRLTVPDLNFSNTGGHEICMSTRPEIMHAVTAAAMHVCCTAAVLFFFSNCFTLPVWQRDGLSMHPRA